MILRTTAGVDWSRGRRCRAPRLALWLRVVDIHHLGPLRNKSARACEGAYWDERSDDEYVRQSGRWYLLDACESGHVAAHGPRRPERRDCEGASACTAKAAACSTHADASKAANKACEAQQRLCAERYG